MSEDDLMFRPASELAGMVRSGEISARELVQSSLDQIEELDPTLNAFVQVDGKGALATADGVGPGDERPFAGVPIAIKNNRPVKGLRLTYGCSLMADHVAEYDHNVTRRLREAGFVIVGTTTLPEYGILPTSEGACWPDPQSVGLAAHPGAPPAARRPRSPPACCRWLTATTAAARSASPRPAAASWAWKPSRGRISVTPELGNWALRDRRRAHAHGRRHGGDARRARRL